MATLEEQLELEIKRAELAKQRAEQAEIAAAAITDELEKAEKLVAAQNDQVKQTEILIAKQEELLSFLNSNGSATQASKDAADAQLAVLKAQLQVLTDQNEQLDDQLQYQKILRTDAERLVEDFFKVDNKTRDFAKALKTIRRVFKSS